MCVYFFTPQGCGGSLLHEDVRSLHKDVRFFTPQGCDVTWQGCEDSLLHEDVSSLHEHMSLLHKDVRGGEKNRDGRHNGERCEDNQTEPGKHECILDF